MFHFISKTPQFVALTEVPRPETLPPFPRLPFGFQLWVYRGIKWASDRAVMVTSWDELTDDKWDPPAMFQTRGDPNTHYIEAIRDHHWICKCSECRDLPLKEAES